MIKVDSGVSMNEYPGALKQHEKFAQYYGLTDTAWYKERKQRILDVGVAEAYKKASLQDRILSTDSIVIPENEVIELPQNNKGSTREAAANGPADPTEEKPPDPPDQPP